MSHGRYVPGTAAHRYPVPHAVRDAAKHGLRLHNEYGMGGTEVGLNTARILSTKKDIAEWKVRHIARYFPRHAGDRLDQKDPPSRGWIAWLLWGGDTGRRWSEGIVQKADKG